MIIYTTPDTPPLMRKMTMMTPIVPHTVAMMTTK